MSSPRSVQEDYLRFDGERLSYNQDLLVWDRSTTADLDNFLSLSLLKKHLQVPESFTGQGRCFGNLHKECCFLCRDVHWKACSFLSKGEASFRLRRGADGTSRAVFK